jgi:low affinity Fe/Cu permease
LKLDELIVAVKGARNKLVNLENMSDEKLDNLQEGFKHLQDQVEETRQRRTLEKSRSAEGQNKK